MSDTPSSTPQASLRPADRDEVANALSFALRFDGRKRVRHADALMADIAAEKLVRYLERSGFVVMKRPTNPGGGAPNHTYPAPG